jgi:hypothetical protein
MDTKDAAPAAVRTSAGAGATTATEDVADFATNPAEASRKAAASGAG